MKYAGTFSAIVLLLIMPFVAQAETWKTPEPITAVNSSGRDLAGWITADGKMLYFASDRTGFPNKEKFDLYVSHLINGNWSAPTALASPPNHPDYMDSQPTLTLDGRYLYFMSTRPGGYGGLDIWVSEKTADGWQEPINLGPGVNSASTDSDPNISPDGRKLIFTSDRPGGYGAGDIYVSEKVCGVWQSAVNMGDTINHSNTTRWDDHASSTYTGKYLFWSYLSNINRSEKVNGVWQTPVVLPAPVNTSGDDVVTFFSECTNTLYMAFNAGIDWDIKVSEWLDAPAPNPCSQLVIPEGEWRVRVTLLEASAVLSNDIYIDDPIQKRLIKKSLKNVGSVVTTPFISAQELVFFIRVNGTPMGLGTYDHYSNSAMAKVERVDPLRYIVGFEDLPADQADFDYNDTVLLIELVGKEVNIHETANYLGELQVVQEAPVDAESNMQLALSEGIASSASVTIPDQAVESSTFSTLVEGDPSLYQDILTDAPFESKGVFLKIELSNGQAQMSNDKKMDLALDLGGVGSAAESAGQDYSLFRFDSDALAWVKVEEQNMPDASKLEASVSQTGLYAVGIPAADENPPGTEETPTIPSSYSDSSDSSDSVNCGMAADSANGRLGSMLAALIYLMPVFIVLLGRKRLLAR